MSNDRDLVQITEIVATYMREVRIELVERWKAWPLDLSKREMYEVIGGLLGRQVTLATQFASAPAIWNPHIAPLIFRTMVDNYITLAWIFADSLDRSRKFILYGLGQAKLGLEHRKSELQAEGHDADNDPIIRVTEAWINSQRYHFLTEVNVGSWSGMDARKMAEEAACLDIYNFAYMPFSAATHSMWHHVARLNLVECPNPLHGYHKMPIDPTESEADISWLPIAAKYVGKAFKLFDEKTGVKHTVPSAYENLVRSLEQLGR